MPAAAIRMASGVASDQLEHLASNTLVVAGVFLGGDDPDALGVERLGGFGQPAIAVGVVEADETDSLDAVGGHVVGDAARHEAVILRRLEGPALIAFHRGNDLFRRGQRDQRDVLLAGDVHQCDRARRRRGADQRVHIVLVDQFAAVGDRAGGIGAVVDDDIFDLLTVDLRGQERHGIAFGDAEAGRRAGGGNGDADLDLSNCRRRQCRRRCQG